MSISLKFNAQNLIDAYQGEAGLLARCILYNLVEPPGNRSPDLMIALSKTLIQELKDANKSQFLSRFPRAMKWALRDDVPPDLAIYVIEQTLALRSRTMRRVVRKIPEYHAYREKMGGVLEALEALDAAEE
jgi:hypothetical protein